MAKKEITNELIKNFLEGRDPQEHIVNLDYNYQSDKITVYYRDDNDIKRTREENFYPFLWATRSACVKLCNGDREQVKQLLKQYNIECIKLDTTSRDDTPCETMEKGYMFMFRAKVPMSYSRFQDFFKKANVPIRSESDEESNFLTVTPQEQFLISTGKRFFKGYDDYNQILRMIFDLETEGLDPKRHRIEWFGIRFARPFMYNGKKIEFEKELQLTGNTREEKDASELNLIETALKIIYTFKPDVITAHNGENFDWNFIIERCKQLNTTIEDVSTKYFDGRSIGKNKTESVLKLGGEVEHFYRTIVPGVIITDSLHAVRRAQATDSNFKEANLKYSTKYLGIVKPNRVYIPGDRISEISNDYEKRYPFNDKDGDWYIYDANYVSGQTEEKKSDLTVDGEVVAITANTMAEMTGSLFPEEEKAVVRRTPEKKEVIPANKEKKFVLYARNEMREGYELVDGHYIVERYLADDLWECDKVEEALNSTDFMLSKIIPVPYQKVVTMGTAGQWKAIMMAWSYENGLAIPNPENAKMTVGGLSRLLKVGYIKNVIKLDYNSLYPSIILTWAISDKSDIMGAMLAMLEYVLTTREVHKKLKKAADKIKTAYEEKLNEGKILSESETVEYNKSCNDFKVEDNRQAVFKKTGNSFFGSYGSVSSKVFPWKSLACAERTTCTGRQSLRLMISHFANLGYEPIVGDSFTPDTPLFIMYTEGRLKGCIDIKPICELINESEVKIDELGREYDYSKKDYKVLCRSGWVEPSYIYRHKTDKDIYEVTDGNMTVEVTEDHSLFNDNQEKIKPSEINENTKLEYYKGEIKKIENVDYMDEYVGCYAADLAEGKIDRVPIKYLNTDRFYMKQFYETFMEKYKEDIKYSKTCLAGLQYLKGKIFKDD